MEPTTEASGAVQADEVREIWALLSPADRFEAIRLLPPPDAESVFLGLSAADQVALLAQAPPELRRFRMRQLPPDDAADVLQRAPEALRPELLGCLDPRPREEVEGLLAFAEDVAGGLMTPRFFRLRPGMTIDQAIAYLREQARERPLAVDQAYVLDHDQTLRGVVSLSTLLATPKGTQLEEIMQARPPTIPADLDQEAVGRLFARHRQSALPVVDSQGRMRGIVTPEDILDVLQEEATEDIQKYGGVETLGGPYLATSVATMIRKRGGWLAALFLGEMLTATAMAFFEQEIARAVVLALFVPLIISSGGNSGSQASTLVIRSMALGEVRLRDWWRVAHREFLVGLALGTLLGAIGFLRIVLWQSVRPIYGEHYLKVALTVWGSLVGVVMFGTLAGSLLPFVLRRLRLDPASASAPFVATLVDVTGLVIYFSVAAVILRGTLL